MGVGGLLRLSLFPPCRLVASNQETVVVAGQDVAGAERALSVALERPREGIGRRVRGRRELEDLARAGMGTLRH